MSLTTRVGDVVLDPFIGSGTTGVVALDLNRRFVGIELNPRYMHIAERRLAREGEDWEIFRSRLRGELGLRET